MNLTYIATFAIVVLGFLTNFAVGQKKFSFKQLEGEWKGTLEYADYKDDKRVKLSTAIEIESDRNGKSAVLKFVYDDFGKIYRDKSTHKIDFTKNQYNLDGDKFSFRQTKDGKLILVGSGTEKGKKVPYRITISIDDKSLSLLKETRTPFQFRNEYKLKRVEKNNYSLRVLTEKQMKEDFAVMRRTLKAVHPGLYRYNSPKELDKKFDIIEAKLSKPLPEGEFFKLISQALSEIKCYHTYTNPFNQRKEIKEALFNRKNYFPFYFHIINRKMIMTENATSKKLAKGSEIKKINGVKVNKIIENLLTATFADGNETIENRIKSLELRAFAARGYSTFDIMFPLFFPPKKGVYRIEAVDFNTKKRTKFEVLAMTKDERTAKMEKRYVETPSYDSGWKFEIWKDGTAYLRASNFITWKLSFKFKSFLAKSFAEIKAKNVKNLIVDIRGNGGGDGDAPIEILRYIAKEEISCGSSLKTYIKTAKVDSELFKYFETYDKQIEVALKKGVPQNFYKKADNGLLEFLFNTESCKTYKPFENSFKGKTYLMIDSANSSAAFTMSRLAKQNKLATLVGQKTGGNKLGFNGGSYLFTYLPNSKFEFDIPIYGYYFDGEQKDVGITPDVIVEQNPNDIGNGLDRELSKVMEMIKGI